jgi:hypothetical protein
MQGSGRGLFQDTLGIRLKDCGISLKKLRIASALVEIRTRDLVTYLCMFNTGQVSFIQVYKALCLK